MPRKQQQQQQTSPFEQTPDAPYGTDSTPPPPERVPLNPDLLTRYDCHLISLFMRLRRLTPGRAPVLILKLALKHARADLIEEGVVSAPAAPDVPPAG